jgi:pSer/pThr/pTyr-binding forkhead associated (FHA) protein
MFNLAIYLLQGLLLISIYTFLLIVIVIIYKDIRLQELPAKKAVLTVVSSNHLSIGDQIPLDKTIVIGRENICDVVLNDNYASARHARIYKIGGVFRIEDLASTNGTFVDGKIISQPVTLKDKNQIKIGQTIFEFRYI